MRLLFLGGAYGSVLAVKCALAGHKVDVVCRAQEAANINNGRLTIHFPGNDGHSIGVSQCKKNIRGIAPLSVEPSDYALCFLCMQEPQFADEDIVSLITQLVSLSIPIISLMNMPLPPYLLGRMGVDLPAAPKIWKNNALWSKLAPNSFTASSPDPQAIIEITHDATRVSLTLASNLKVAPFQNRAYQKRLEQLANDVNGLRVRHKSSAWSPRVRLVAHESPYVPLAKWPMLIAGNFRCVGLASAESIRSAIWSDLNESKSIYEWVTALCGDLVRTVDKSCDLDQIFVPFDRYANAAQQLTFPSSVARGLLSGATDVERVDRLLQELANALNRGSEFIDSVVDLVDEILTANRARERSEKAVKSLSSA